MALSSSFRIRDLSRIAMAAAMAILLGYWKIYRLPQGGSITLETIPILFVSLTWGIRLGLFSGLITGCLKLLFSPFIIHPIQILLDYPIPFLLLGLSAILPRFPRTGIIFGNFTRFLSHFVSGIIFFGSYGPEHMSVWHYSAFYNLSYIIPETLIGLILIPPLLRRYSLLIVNQDPYHSL